VYTISLVEIDFMSGFRWKIEYALVTLYLEVISKKFPSSFQKNREKPQKSDGKTEIFTQNQFI